jgi:uncharacterized protein YycO
MPSSVIKATRSTITNRLPVCGFAIRTGRNPWYEVALATDPQLFAPDAKDRRRPVNFFSTRAAGPLPAERGEAVFLVPPDVLGRFAGQPRVYYALATFPDRSRSVAEVPGVPTDATPFVSLSQSFTGQALRRLIGVPSAGAGLSGNGGSYGSTSPEALSWAGDAPRPGTEAVTRGGNGSSNGRAAGSPPQGAPAPPAAPSSQGLEYDDGFGRAFWSGSRPTPLSADIPLDPGTGGRSIGPDALAAGDIVLSTGDSTISAAIRGATSAPVSHALLYVGDGQVVEAVASGVELHMLADAIADATVAVAFRHPSITAEQAARVRDYAGQQLGRPYDTWGVVRQAAFRLDRAVFCSGKSGEELERCISWTGRVNLGTGTNDAFFCSQLVLAAYESAGVPLTSTPPTWSSPGEIAELSLSGTLGYVGHLKAPPLGASQGVRGSARPFTAGRGARPFAGPVDIDWDEVVLTPDTGQPNAYAAAAAMVVGWRDRVCLTPDTILDAVNAASGDPANREAYASAWDLVPVRGAAYETVELKGMLDSHGPLWAANGDRSAPNAGHAFVITGVCGDGTAAGTSVCIDDPWGQVTGSPAAATSNPAPGGPGARYSVSFQELATQFPPRAGVPPTHAWLELLHARDVTGRVPGRVGCAAASTQSLGARIRPLASPQRAGRPFTRGVALAGETDAEGNEDHGIEGPIPDETPATVAASLARARALTAAEYPQASRFVAARWFRVPAAPRTISRVVIHITDGGSNINGTIGWFQNPVNADGTPRRVSAHYVVGRDGEVVQMVEHANVAWHASSANGDSIGIEHCANTRGLNPTPAQYCGSAALVRWLCDTYGIPIDRDHVLGHSEADPRTTHTGCPNAVWDWSHFMGLVQSGTCSEPAPSSGQALGRAAPKPFTSAASAPFRSRPLVYRPLRAAPLGAVSVHWDEVQLVPQFSGDSCWAAAASMVVGWRDRVSIDPAQIPRPADITGLAQAFDLEGEPGQCYTVDGFADLLTRKGPLWVAALVPGFHAIVVTGVQGDGDPDTTLVYVSDPWEREPGTPGAPGPYRANPGGGSRYTMTYRNFVNEYEAVPQDPSYRHITVQILHARDTGGRTPGAVPTAQSFGLRSRAASAFRYSRGLAVSAFASEAMERMRATFLANRAAANRLNCIQIMNEGLRSLFDARLRDSGGGDLALGSSVQATMAKLQEYGLADVPTDFEYFDAQGRPTRGVNRPETLRQSVEAWIYQQCEVNQQSAYYAFGLSVMDGYHSVLLPVAFSGTGDPSTKVYWADQIYSGWDDVTGSLDSRITDRTQRWWDGATPKPRTRCRVWPLLG